MVPGAPAMLSWIPEGGFVSVGGWRAVAGVGGGGAHAFWGQQPDAARPGTELALFVDVK